MLASFVFWWFTDLGNRSDPIKALLREKFLPV